MSKFMPIMKKFENNFTESHHAFLAATFYQALTKELNEEGVELFQYATMKYGEQRGTRMAYRALRDGKPLDYFHYFLYSEWETTDPHNFKIEIPQTNPDYENYVFRCPWHTQFVELGLKKAGEKYCEFLDTSIVRGFNPHLTIDVNSFLYNSSYCHFKFKNAKLTPLKLKKLNQAKIRMGMKNKLPFEYHCAHLFMTFKTIIQYRFGTKANKILSRILKIFTQKYSNQLAQRILSYENFNFNKLPDKEMS